MALRIPNVFARLLGGDKGMKARKPLAVLANDYAGPGATLSVTGYTSPSYGSVTLNLDGTFSYTQTSANPIGSDVFTYTVSDGLGHIATTTVTMLVPVAAAATPYAQYDFSVMSPRVKQLAFTIELDDGTIATTFVNFADNITQAAVATQVKNDLTAAGYHVDVNGTVVTVWGRRQNRSRT